MAAGAVAVVGWVAGVGGWLGGGRVYLDGGDGGGFGVDYGGDGGGEEQRGGRGAMAADAIVGFHICT